MMSAADYEMWKALQNAAADAMLLAEDHRQKGDLARWYELFQKAIDLQEAATKFARSATPQPFPTG